jgi:hypothetical protein
MIKKLKYVLFVILFTFTLSCKKENTYWTSNWSTPLLYDSIGISNLLVLDTNLTINSSNNYTLNYSKSLYKIKLTDYIKIPDTTITQDLGIVFPSLNVNPGTTLTNLNQENKMNFGDAQLTYCIVKKGKISVTLKNPLETKVFYIIELPNFTKDGEIVHEEMSAEPGTTDNPTIISKTLDLSNYHVNLSGNNESSYNTMVSNFTLQLDPNGQVVKVTNKDISSLQITIQDVELNYARGYFGNFTIEDTYSQDLSFFNHFLNKGVSIKKINLGLSLINSCKIGARGKFPSITSKNTKLGSSIELLNNQINNPFFISNATGSWGQIKPYKKEINLNENNSNLTKFIENLGNQYVIDYSFEVNPYGNLSGGWDEIFPESEIELQLNSEIPLDYEFNNLVFEDTIPLEINPNKNIQITKGDFILEAQNKFPFDVTIELDFLDQNDKLIGKLSSDSTIKNTINNLNSVEKLTYSIPNMLLDNIELIKKTIIRTKIQSLPNQTEIPLTSNVILRLYSDFTTIINN